MMRLEFMADGGAPSSTSGNDYETYYPSPYSAPAQSYASPDPIGDAFYGLPVGPTGEGQRFVSPDPIEDAFYGLPVSRLGPTVSIAPRAALDPNLRAGSLFSGGLPTQANFRAGRGMAYQRAFTVDQQERLRRRRRNRFTGYAS